MFVKVCGLRTEADVEAAVSAGADAVGFVFTESPRKVAPRLARDLAAEVPSRVLTVGVFRGVPADEAGEIALSTGMRAVQLHGSYPESAFRAFVDLPVQVIRATSVSPGTDIRTGAFGEDLLLLDSPEAGSGKRWDLSVEGPAPEGRWILAGGLDAENVAGAIAAARPWGVDVSSGVESSRGVKDPVRIRDFVAAVRAAS